MTFKNKKRFTLAFSMLAFGLSCFYIAWAFSWIEILKALTKVNIALFVTGATSTVLLFWLFRSLRWYYIIQAMGHKVNFFDIYFISVSSLGLSVITPLQSGEALKVELLKRKISMPRLYGYMIFGYEKIIDLLVVVSLAIFSIILSDDLEENPGVKYILVAGLTLSVSSLLFLIRKINKKSSFFKIKNLGNNNILEDKKIHLAVLALTYLSWLSIAAGWHYLFRSVNIELAFIESLLVMALGTLANIISLIPGALGVSEASISLLLVKLGIELQSANTGAVIIRIYTLVFILFALPHFFFYSMKNKATHRLRT